MFKFEPQQIARLNQVLQDRADEQDIPRRERLTAFEYLDRLLQDPEALVAALDPYDY